MAHISFLIFKNISIIPLCSFRSLYTNITFAIKITNVKLCTVTACSGPDECAHLLVILLSSTGNYFASHFFMGGEKFDTPHPEGYLFGENMDLNFLGNRPVQVKTRVFTPSWLNAQSSFNSWSNSRSFRMWHLHPMSLWRLWGVLSTLGKTLCAWSGKKTLSQQQHVFDLGCY